MLEYYAHIVQEDLLVLNRYGTILRAFIKCKVKTPQDLRSQLHLKGINKQSL